MNGSETVLNVYLGKRVIANLSLDQDQSIDYDCSELSLYTLKDPPRIFQP
jgi:hypothetical protein